MLVRLCSSVSCCTCALLGCENSSEDVCDCDCLCVVNLDVGGGVGYRCDDLRFSNLLDLNDVLELCLEEVGKEFEEFFREKHVQKGAHPYCTCTYLCARCFSLLSRQTNSKARCACTRRKRVIQIGVTVQEKEHCL
jgi:hypothetical protein